MGVDDKQFRKAMGSFASGVTVVTTLDDRGDPTGVTVSAFCSLSLDPPLVMVSLAKRTHRLADFETGHFAVNILSDAQRDVSIRFAARGDEKWSGLDWTPGESGAPALPGSLSVIECAVEAVHDGGDHDIIVGRVVNLSTDPVAEPLVYFRGGYHQVDPVS